MPRRTRHNHPGPRTSRLNERDREILDTLVTKVPMLSLYQLADEFFESDRANAARRLQTLSMRGLIAKHRLNVRYVPQGFEPILRWNPGQDDPNFSRVSSELIKRWRRQPTHLVTVYVRGAKLAKLTGARGKDRPRHILQASHDLGLARVYLHFRSQRPSDALRWRGENSLAHRPRIGQIPDAVLLDEQGHPRTAIEYGGQYSVKRLSKLHRHCKSRSLSLEIW